jgi:Rod binding domain-containing protein
MNVDLTSALGQMATTSTPLPSRDASKALKAARDFESVLLTSVFAALEKSFSWDHEDTTPGATSYRAMGTKALADAVAASGGIGIGKFILGHLPVTKVASKGGTSE